MPLKSYEIIRKIAQAFIKGQDVERFVKIITNEEGAENDYNLTPSPFRPPLLYMREFYLAYCDLPKVQPLVAQFGWTHNRRPGTSLNISITQHSQYLSDSVMGLAGQPMQLQYRINGIDFSGDQDNGNKVWIAEGIVKTDSLLIEDCFRARDLSRPQKATALVPTFCLRDVVPLNPADCEAIRRNYKWCHGLARGAPQDSGNDKDFIKENQDAAFGLDFTFGLPGVLVEQESWKEFIITFPRIALV